MLKLLVSSDKLIDGFGYNRRWCWYLFVRLSTHIQRRSWFGLELFAAFLERWIHESHDKSLTNWLLHKNLDLNCLLGLHLLFSIILISIKPVPNLVNVAFCWELRHCDLANSGRFTFIRFKVKHRLRSRPPRSNSHLDPLLVDLLEYFIWVFGFLFRQVLVFNEVVPRKV